MKKLNRIVTEIVGWVFLAFAMLITITVFVIFNSQPAILVGATACTGILFAVMGFGFLLLERFSDLKIKIIETDGDIDKRDYKQDESDESEKNKQNWIIFGIVIGIVAIGIALIPVIFKTQ
jgi:hypothetical protein